MTGNELIRGDIYWVNLDPTVGSEIQKKRPAVIVQNNVGNRFSPLTIVAPISSTKEFIKRLPILVALRKGEGGIPEDSFVNCGQIRTVDIQRRLGDKLGTLPLSKMLEINEALRVSLDL